jgi:hypothetical protein
MKVQLSHRLDGELAAWATGYAKSRESSRAVVIEEALRHLRERVEGDPVALAFDGRQPAGPRVAVKAPAVVVRASQLAERRDPNPVGTERQKRIQRDAERKQAK